MSKSAHWHESTRWYNSWLVWPVQPPTGPPVTVFVMMISDTMSRFFTGVFQTVGL
jgi:hypothetical protein